MECLLVLEKEAQWSGATSKRMRAAGSIIPLPLCAFLSFFRINVRIKLLAFPPISLVKEIQEFYMIYI